jgi:hypothetical protein
MRNYTKSLLVAGIMALAGIVALVARAEGVLQDFVRLKGDQLVEGGKGFRFISFNIPNLLLIEDNVGFFEQNPWRLPDQFEIEDALESVRQAGGTVVRTYVLTVLRTNDLPGTPRHVLGPGKFNEDAFRTLDQVLAMANEKGIRLVIPLVDNWSWMGGRAEYAGFRGKGKDAFWTDPQVIKDYEVTVRFIVNRTNSVTGVPYRDDKAILCWETGNELESPAPWTREIAGFIKSLDRNHLVMDGFNASRLRDESLSIPDVDIVTTHHYPGGVGKFPDLVRWNWGKAKGKKAYVVGEFGFVETQEMGETMKVVRETGTAGALLWSLRFRDRDGGFYWHSEPAGGNRFKAFHWPGFKSGADYDEENLLAMVQREAYAIRGLSVPPVKAPVAPHLLPVTEPGALTWQGSAGATTYAVERAGAGEAPLKWKVIAADINETAVQYRPLFVDTDAPDGSLYYRVRALNRAGASEPSNVVGPVNGKQRLLVDEMEDFSKTFAHEGVLELSTHNSRQAKEDAHRVAGKAGARLIYQLPSPVEGFKVFVFFPHGIADLKFSASTDGQTYRDISAAKEACSQGEGDYHYWEPVMYSAEKLPEGGRFLKLEFTGEAQIGRLELRETSNFKHQ